MNLPKNYCSDFTPMAGRNAPDIHEWVEQTFKHQQGPKLFLEFGSYDGTDGIKLAMEVQDAWVHMYEPYEKNILLIYDNLKQVSHLNLPIAIHQLAVGAENGYAPFFLSKDGFGGKDNWWCSSSIRKPKEHLTVYDVTFGETITVPVVKLDSIYEGLKLISDTIDFIWADIQGAEVDLIEGGKTALQHTKYLYTEYSDKELYEGQIDLPTILKMLPNWEIVYRWPMDVLLRNKDLT